ncbi:atherin-like [Rhopalosiphum padi]|uniref:atherin-like n=1 Tax=Rhopalosiphum padi TaxID=40932 RepID=UPI00298E36E2|nr:atherin-like [Rhopalosiphum padi]XP_060846599.1 atherin-like [Rhopalosiphum padi]XP_060846600.1 atherin-like [Rhopalosiphum padi]XP_060846601.1 atherin-like [Rhopalosiphum padi]XP_060846602.1 atherin-like [Rhopalosiphum padi]
MAKDKKPEKNNGSKKGTVTCERTYVSDRCSRTAGQETRRSPPSSPATIRVLDLPCRHQRRGAVRDKRTAVSLDKPRPAHQRADNAYVETPFVDGAVSLQLQQGPSTASCSSALYRPPPYSAVTAPNTRAANGGRTDLPVIEFAADMMRSSAEPPPRPGEGIIDEFPAYVPWKAEQQRAPQPEAPACNVCHKCRCATCQKLCKYPGMRVCGVLDVQSRCDEACVETTTVCVPCVRKTARCPAADAARAQAAAAAAANADNNANAAAEKSADDDDDDDDNDNDNNDGDDRPAAAAVDARAAPPKCRLRWLLCCLCCPCPCCSVDDVVECSTGCRGNVNVSGCECVDWEALRRNNRRRVNAAAAAVAAARDRRRCRDNHYYITALPHLAANHAADKSAAVTPTVEKKSRLRNFLRF